MKQISIGSWDEEQRQIQVEDDSTVGSALRQAGVTVAETQSVSTFSNATNVGLNDNVVDGETYLLVSNSVSGI